MNRGNQTILCHQHFRIDLKILVTDMLKLNKTCINNDTHKYKYIDKAKQLKKTHWITVI